MASSGSLKIRNFIRRHFLPASRTFLRYSEVELKELISQAEKILLKQPSFLELRPPIAIAGNIQGQFLDLLTLFYTGGWPPRMRWLFLGDYVDRGPRSLECICLLLALKILYPESVFLLRGHHEDEKVNSLYGFKEECRLRASVNIFNDFQDVFNALPVAACIQGRIFCVHGGLSPELNDFDQLRRLGRPLSVPPRGLVCDLLWSDPNRFVHNWSKNSRGLSYTYGTGSVREFLQNHDLDLIVRSHQVVRDGFQFFSGKGLVTLWSAPNYGGHLQNNGAIMVVNKKMVCGFKVIQALPDPQMASVMETPEGVTMTEDGSEYVKPPVVPGEEEESKPLKQ